VTSGPRIARFRRISSAGHVRHIGFGSETLGTLPCDSRSAVRSGQFALARAIEPSPSSKTTPFFWYWIGDHDQYEQFLAE
jgi:hypothetical protein